MNTIWKFPLAITDMQIVTVPASATPLCVDLDPIGKHCIWFQVNDQEQTTRRVVYVVGTGNPIPDGATHYIGSFLDGRFMWHIYM